MTSKNNKLHFLKDIPDEDGYIQITITPCAYEIESLNKEIKRISIDEGRYSNSSYPFTIKPNFSTLGSIIEISPQGPIISFIFDDSIRNHSGYHAITLSEESNLSQNPVDMLSFDKNFLECHIAQGMMIFKGKISGIIHNFTMDVDPG